MGTAWDKIPTILGAKKAPRLNRYHAVVYHFLRPLSATPSEPAVVSAFNTVMAPTVGLPLVLAGDTVTLP